jgi:hypothetical protein
MRYSKVLLIVCFCVSCLYARVDWFQYLDSCVYNSTLSCYSIAYSYKNDNTVYTANVFNVSTGVKYLCTYQYFSHDTNYVDSAISYWYKHIGDSVHVDTSTIQGYWTPYGKMFSYIDNGFYSFCYFINLGNYGIFCHSWCWLSGYDANCEAYGDNFINSFLIAWGKNKNRIMQLNMTSIINPVPHIVKTVSEHKGYYDIRGRRLFNQPQGIFCSKKGIFIILK